MEDAGLKLLAKQFKIITMFIRLIIMQLNAYLRKSSKLLGTVHKRHGAVRRGFSSTNKGREGSSNFLWTFTLLGSKIVGFFKIYGVFIQQVG